MANKVKILVVEDEEIIRKGLIDVFVFHGYEVDFAVDGKEGLEKATSGKYDLIILDVMLPFMDGFSICNEIRSTDRSQPIIMLTAKTTDEDIITGLSLGADDYISKPFSVRELVLRVEAVLRRAGKSLDNEWELEVGEGIVIDTRNLVGRYKDREDVEKIEFTRREIDILRYLKANSDRPVPRGELLENVWDYKKGSDIETRTVDIHIAKLRRKIEIDPKAPRFLITMRGEGYKLLSAEDLEQT